jgi:pyruvate dehydrogenase E1 component
MALAYKESPHGRMIQEGISEAAALADFTALATSYSTWSSATVPFYIFYSMFGFQRVGDAIWAAADARARGFLCGATAGRTTLSGEGLQHCDGHSLLLASTNPAVRAYDCAFAYELASVVRSGLQAMESEDFIYYLTVYNENYVQPQRPAIPGLDEAIAKGAYLLSSSSSPVLRLAASGPLVRTALAAQATLADLGVPVEVWSVTSFTELRREAVATERRNRLSGSRNVPYVSQCFGDLPVVAVTDWMQALPELVARFTGPMVALGTDGFGVSDTREALRRFFEVDKQAVVYAALSLAGLDALAAEHRPPLAPDPAS